MSTAAYFLKVPETHVASLGVIRHWEGLTIAFDQETVWVKGLSEQQVESKEILCLPHKTIYAADDQQLYIKGNLLPEQRIPNLLWSPIDKGLPLKWPAQNHNYFGIDERIKVHFGADQTERTSTVQIIDIQALESFISTTTKARLLPLKWVLLNHKKALIMGQPLLPLPGVTYWQDQQFMIPTGYQLAYPILKKVINELINPNADALILWQEDSSYSLIPTTKIQPLSISSFRKTITQSPLDSTTTAV